MVHAMRASVMLLGGAVLVCSQLACGGFVQRSGQSTIGVMPGVVNDPGNRSLRRAIMRFGLGEFCKQLTHRGVPLQMRAGEPTAGRFMANTCNYQELESGDVFVQFAGPGYVWTNVTWRLGFEATGAVQYNQDFLMDGATMYAYFRTRAVVSKGFEAKMVEQGGAVASTVTSVVDGIAKELVQSQLERGFTVIRNSNGSVDFAVGMINKGERPAKPFEVHEDKRVTMMNERTNVAGNQLDFLGPFTVEDSKQALFLTMSVDGAPGVDAIVVDKSTGDQWLNTFVYSSGVPQPPTPPISIDMVPTRTQWTKAVPVPKGHYYVVLDNSAAIGNVAPTFSGSAVPSTAMVSVVVQLGDASN